MRGSSIGMVWIVVISCLGCRDTSSHHEGRQLTHDPTADVFPTTEQGHGDKFNGPLLLSRFTSFEQFRSVVKVEYASDIYGPERAKGKRPKVRLTHNARQGTVLSELVSGLSQADFAHARSAGWWEKVKLAWRCPYAVVNRRNLMRVENLARRRPFYFGQGDIGFYHLAEAMVSHIPTEDRVNMSVEDLGEKGYLNTFNHITAQAMMTSLYNEKMADFIADIHELYNLPSLASGDFTAGQLADINEGPVDNYLDMINNEWGQELGKVLQQKYQLDSRTLWTPALLADYLNDIQQYLGWSFQIAFSPFTPSDPIILQFAGKINFLMRARSGYP